MISKIIENFQNSGSCADFPAVRGDREPSAPMSHEVGTSDMSADTAAVSQSCIPVFSLEFDPEVHHCIVEIDPEAAEIYANEDIRPSVIYFLTDPLPDISDDDVEQVDGREEETSFPSRPADMPEDRAGQIKLLIRNLKAWKYQMEQSDPFIQWLDTEEGQEFVEEMAVDPVNDAFAKLTLGQRNAITAAIHPSGSHAEPFQDAYRLIQEAIMRGLNDVEITAIFEAFGGRWLQEYMTECDIVADIARCRQKHPDWLEKRREQQDRRNERERERRAEARDQAAEEADAARAYEIGLNAIDEQYPLPAVPALDLVYDHTEIRLPWIFEKKKAKTKDGEFESLFPISSPFSVIARTKLVDRDNREGLRIILQGSDGGQQKIDIQRGQLARDSGKAVLEELMDKGLRVSNSSKVTAILMAAHAEEEIAIVDKPGWRFDDGNIAFVAPSGEVIGDGDFLLSSGSEMGAPAGTLGDWRAAIQIAASIPNTHHWTLSAMMAFVGPIIELTGSQSCGIVLFGESSGGKSTGLAISTSAWCSPEMGKGKSLTVSARNTTNKLEYIAQRANGCFMGLDEAGLMSGPQLHDLGYMIANCEGKGRMSANLTERATPTWKTFAVINSEHSVGRRLEMDGLKLDKGMVPRFPNISTEGLNRQVAAEDLQKISAGIRKNYGHAGPAFAKYLMDEGFAAEPTRLDAMIDERQTRFLSASADATLRRTARVFALIHVAGSLAKDAGILPENVNVDATVNWAWKAFLDGDDAQMLDPLERIKGNIATWVQARWGRSIISLSTQDRASTICEGYYDADHVYILKDCLEEAAGAGGMNQHEISRCLQTARLLSKVSSSKNRYVAYVPKIGKCNAYCLPRDVFGRDEKAGQAASSSAPAAGPRPARMPQPATAQAPRPVRGPASKTVN